jgi:hypothetical protein
LWAVRWYCRYGVSYRDLEEMLTERGVPVDQVMPCSYTAGHDWYTASAAGPDPESGAGVLGVGGGTGGDLLPDLECSG